MKSKLHMTTQKQLQWRLRSHFLWRFKGINLNVPAYTPLTKKERQIIFRIKRLQEELLMNFTESSRELGFKALYRDPFGNAMKYDPRNEEFINGRK